MQPGWLGLQSPWGRHGRVLADISSTRGLWKKEGIQDSPKMGPGRLTMDPRGTPRIIYHRFSCHLGHNFGGISWFLRKRRKHRFATTVPHFGGFLLLRKHTFLIFRSSNFLSSWLRSSRIPFEGYRVLFWRQRVDFGAILDTRRIQKSAVEVPKYANGLKKAPRGRWRAHSVLVFFQFSCSLHKMSAMNPQKGRQIDPTSALDKPEITSKNHPRHFEKPLIPNHRRK